jgi:hypothetical protein
MASPALTHEHAGRPIRRRRGNGLLQLSWPHYWLLTAILGGMLALVALAFLIASRS